MPSIPHTIHQTWHSTDYLKWPVQAQVWRTSWSSQTDREYKLRGDAECAEFIQTHFPKLMDVYNALPTGAERADLYRYCLLHEEGGLWVDVDTTCMEPVSTWPIDDCSLLTGMHGVAGSAAAQAAIGFVRPAQLCQWALGAAPKHPVLAAVIRELEQRVRAELKQNGTLARTPKAIANRTGAGLWTDCVLQSLKVPDPTARWESLLVEPFEQDGTRILPARAFAWGDRNVRQLPRSKMWDRVLLRHHAMASWK